jgi:hypothetical protein
MDKGTIFVYCCPSTFSLTSPPLKYKDSLWLWGVGLGGGGGGSEFCVVGHILQEFSTLFLTKFRTYKIAKQK